MPTSEQYQKNRKKYAAYFQKHYKLHKDRVKARSKAYRAANPEKVRNFILKGKFGITLDQYNKLLQKQNGVCAICLNPPKLFKNLSVDHNHETKQIRGLLCYQCNLLLGLAKDNKLLLQTAVTYLQQAHD